MKTKRVRTNAAAKRYRNASREGRAIYTPQDIAALKAVRDYYRYPCGKLAAPLIREQMDFPASEPEFGVTDAVRAGLPRISPATIDRKLREEKKRLRPHGISGTKPGYLICGQAQVRTHYHIRPGLDSAGGLKHLGRTEIRVRDGQRFACKRRDVGFTRSRPTGKTTTAMRDTESISILTWNRFRF